MFERIKYQKSYTRDTTLVIQQIWHRALTDGIKRNFNVVCQISPVSIDYINNGVIEIWESKGALDFIKQELTLGSFKRPKLFWDFIVDYEKSLGKFTEVWKNPILSSKEALISFIKEVDKHVFGDLLIVFLSEQDEHSNEVVKKAKDMRSEDQYFASNDDVIRKSIAHLYPEITNYEVSLKFSEIVSEDLPSIEECKKRFKNFIFTSDGYCEIETLIQFKRKNPTLVFEEENIVLEENSFMGEVAFKGLVTGRVKIVRSMKELSKINQGDILVSPMTTPMFIVAMKRAGAFVTDEGGVLSHVAVVARELQKPCVIGTKISTKVLKDEDLVEVDANNGIVKILKRAN